MPAIWCEVNVKISDVEAIHLRLPDVSETADGTQDVLIVRVYTDDGLVGIGEVSSQSFVCKAIIEAPRSAERRHGLRQIVVGEVVDDVAALWERMYHETNRYGRRGAVIHAISGLDLALWDLKGKAEGKPIHSLWGGAERETVRAYASHLFGDTPEETARRAGEAVDQGLTAAKFGWGPFGKDPKLDVAHIEAAREVLGDERELMVDAGCTWDWETALKRVELFEPYHLSWLEEPLSQDDLKGYAELCSRSLIPIAAGELETTHYAFEELVDCGVHVLQPDVAISGGLTVCRRAGELASAKGIRVVPHCYSTGINLAGSLQWIATHPTGDLVEYCRSPSPLMRELVSNLPVLEDGRVRVPTGPGLGIDLDEDVIERYRVEG